MYLASDITLDVNVKKIIEILFIKTEKKENDDGESSEDDMFPEEEDDEDSDVYENSQGSQFISSPRKIFSSFKRLIFPRPRNFERVKIERS